LMSALNQVLPMPSNKKYGQQMQNNSWAPHAQAHLYIRRTNTAFGLLLTGAQSVISSALKRWATCQRASRKDNSCKFSDKIPYTINSW
jgi:hypothetical protein